MKRKKLTLGLLLIVGFVLLTVFGFPYGWSDSGKKASATAVQYFTLLSQDDPSIVYPLLVPPEQGGDTSFEQLKLWMHHYKWGGEQTSVMSIGALPSVKGILCLVRLRLDYPNGDYSTAWLALRKIDEKWKILSIQFRW